MTIRPDWEDVKIPIMREILIRKFIYDHPANLGNKLIETGSEEIVERNIWHDNFWGVCTCTTLRCQNKKGQNQLGHLLEEVRGILLHRWGLIKETG